MDNVKEQPWYAPYTDPRVIGPIIGVIIGVIGSIIIAIIKLRGKKKDTIYLTRYKKSATGPCYLRDNYT